MKLQKNVTYILGFFVIFIGCLVYVKSYANLIPFDENLLISDAFLIRPNPTPAQLTIAASNYNFNNIPVFTVIFIGDENYKLQKLPTVKLIPLYAYNNQRKIHAYIAKAKVAAKDAYIADLTGDQLINFQIDNKYQDNQIEDIKKSLKKMIKRNEIILSDNKNDVFLDASLDDLLHRVITPIIFPAGQILIDNGKVELVCLNGADPQKFLADFLDKKYPIDKNQLPRALVFNLKHENYNFSNLISLTSIDRGWLMEADNWHKFSSQAILKNLLEEVSQKWIL